jgi:hypothetical protein
VSEQWLLIEGAVLVATIKVALILLPFRTVSRLLTRLAPEPSTGVASKRDADKIGWAVSTAGRHAFGSKSCLPQALAARTMLARAGQVSLLRIGVARLEGQFFAHAWVECGGRVIVGSPQVEQFTPLRGLDIAAL